tara:strand:+ start:1356 stop:2081 length:726 start_codon:yes stop_codon:yes gene_type:complete
VRHSYTVIIPLHNEAECIGQTLDELLPLLPAQVSVAVGLNGCSDTTRNECAGRKVVIGETHLTGYGHGCLAAVEATSSNGLAPDAYLFYAGDGANRPEDLLRLIQVHESEGQPPFIMGLREFQLGSWFSEFGRALPNLILGALCRALGGQFSHDLGPLRLIRRDLFERLEMQELTWGWTIEAQLRAAQLGIRIQSIPVEERPRTGGTQKVSGVSLSRSLRIGAAIGAAAIRTAKRAPARDQ